MESKRQQYEILKGQLKQERSSFLPLYRDLADHVLCQRVRSLPGEGNKGDRRNLKIIDSTATLAARTLRSGMMAGVTSPARPWFRLSTPDPEMAEFGKVKEYLHTVTQRMGHTFLKSNLYNKLPVVYGDLGVFATAPISVEEHLENVIHTSDFPVGSYMIAKDRYGRVNVFFREFRMTVRQVVETFGEKNERTGKAQWDNFSAFVKNAWDNSNYEFWVDLCHLIQPNNDYNPKLLQSKFKRFSSCYYESGTADQVGANYMNAADDNKFLRESGYDLFPILVPRWETTAEDVYGTSCPGMDALGDIKQLQLGEKRSAEAIEKMVRPPMQAPTALRSQKVSILPGDVTYVDAREGMQGFRPVYEVNPHIQELEHKQDQVRNRIQRAFYEDLFLMLASSDRRQITAREIEERHEEKLLALGPVLEQLNQDLLDPLIDITFSYMENQGLLPEAPGELQGVALKVEYISVMAQAQKLITLAGNERFLGFVGQIAQLDPRVLKKVDTLQLVDDYGEGCGVSPKIIVSDEKVQEMLAQEAKAQQAAQAAEMVQAGAGAARDLSQANMESDNVLSRMIDGANAGSLVEGT
jgi:hypothetical protein